MDTLCMDTMSTCSVEPTKVNGFVDPNREELEDEDDIAVSIEDDSSKDLMLYNVTDNPPWILTSLYASQIIISKISSCAGISLMVNDVVCGSSALLSQLMSTTLFMTGLGTFLQSSVGVRLPIFQGPTFVYILPMMLRSKTDWACPSETLYDSENNNITSLNMTESGEEEWRSRILRISGSLMMISVFHTLLGMLGIIGFLMKYIGPLTIIPALVLIIFEILKKLVEFAEIHWGIAAFTTVVTLILSSYIGDVPIPLPSWTRKRGCHIARSKILRSYAIVIAIFIGWLFAYILTISGGITNDPNVIQYKGRTDSRQEVIDMATWFYFPYPGQYGVPRFDLGIFFSLIAAMLTSVLDSVGDYLACSKICRVPKPPPHATNRGLVVEGFCSILSGAFGACHATTTYSGLIGMLALTGVASRVVFVLSGAYLMMLGLVGKIAAFFVTIPRPVIAGNSFVTMGSLMGMCATVLEDVDMSRSRNIMTFGFAVVMGKCIPDWINANQELVNTGNELADQLIFALMGNPMFVGGFIGCFLDNTLPGKVVKHPVETEQTEDEVEDKDQAKIISDIYDPPFIGDLLRRHRWTRFIPIFPGFQINAAQCGRCCKRKR